MSSIGYRKQGETAPHYNPERDYAYITGSLLVTAIERMELDMRPDLKKWREDHNILPAEISELASALAMAQRDFIKSTDPVNSFDAALQRRDFFSHRMEAREYFFAMIGYVFCGAWFSAVREVSLVGEASPAQTDMTRFSSAVRKFVTAITESNYDPKELDKLQAEPLKMANDVLGARVVKLTESLQETLKKVAQLEDELIAARKSSSGRPSWFSRLLKFFKARSADAKIPDA